MNGTDYRRLPGRRVAWTSFGRRSLWLGTDHVLSIVNRGYSEEYKRFYYRDIQAFVLTYSAAWLFGNLVLGAIAGLLILLFALGYFVWQWPAWGLIALGFWAAFWLLVFLINFVRGETCTTVIRTAVQSERLPSLNRLRTARRAIGQIQELVEQTQGRISLEAMEAFPTLPFAPTVPAAQPGRQIRHYSGKVHAFLFIQLLAFSIVSFATIFYSGMISYVLISALYLAIVITLILALMRQNNSDLDKSVKGIAWSSFAFLWVFTVAGYGYAMFLMLGSAARGVIDSLIRIISEVSPMESQMLLFLHIFAVVFGLGLGAAGLIFLHNFQSRSGRKNPGEAIA